MVFSISPGPAPVSEAEFFEKYAQMWRISDDFWDDWKLLRQQFDYTRDWAQFVGKNGTWPDADMLPLGKFRVTDKEGGGTPTKFTPDEQQTVMTLWSIFRSPLIFGGDLPSNDAATTALITNKRCSMWIRHSTADIKRWSREIFAFGSPRRAVRRPLCRRLQHSESLPKKVDLAWDDIGLRMQLSMYAISGRHQDLGKVEDIHTQLRPHASVLYRVHAGE